MHPSHKSGLRTRVHDWVVTWGSETDPRPFEHQTALRKGWRVGNSPADGLTMPLAPGAAVGSQRSLVPPMLYPRQSHASLPKRQLAPELAPAPRTPGRPSAQPPAHSPHPPGSPGVCLTTVAASKYKMLLLLFYYGKSTEIKCSKGKSTIPHLIPNH